MTGEASRLEHFRDVRGADVYKAGVRAATLTRSPEGVSFTYLPGYLEGDGPAVATTLPKTDEPTRLPAGAVPPFFAGLLPEGRRLSSLQRAVKTSADDELSLLLVVGRDTVGDVQVVPTGEPPEPEEAYLRVEKDWCEVRFADLLAEAGIDRVALPGVQEKVSAGMISVPVGRAGNRFILKLDPPEYPHVVENEAFFLNFARQARIRAAEAQVVHDADHLPGLLVTRFDRLPLPDGRTASVAMEDACQVLARWPADKYSVTCEDTVIALADRCAARGVAARTLFQQVCFGWLTGNGDIHAKNLAIVATADGEWRASPAFDVPSTLPYGDNTFALPLQGATEGLSRRRLLAFGEAVGLPSRTCEKALDEMLRHLGGLDEVLAEGALPFDAQTIADLRAALRYRRRQASLSS